MVCLTAFEPVPGCATGDVGDGIVNSSWFPCVFDFKLGWLQSDVRLGNFHCNVRLVISLFKLIVRLMT